MMAQVSLSISFWIDALLNTAYILNCVSSKLVSSTPYKLRIGRKPNFAHLRPWGSVIFVDDHFRKFDNLIPKAKNISLSNTLNTPGCKQTFICFHYVLAFIACGQKEVRTLTNINLQPACAETLPWIGLFKIQLNLNWLDTRFETRLYLNLDSILNESCLDLY